MTLPTVLDPRAHVGITNGVPRPWPDWLSRLGDWIEPGGSQEPLVPDLIPSRKTTAVVASPFAGKSTLVRQVAAAATQAGGTFLGRPVRQVLGPVWVFLTDYDQEKYRDDLAALGADMERVYLVTAPEPDDKPGWTLRRQRAESEGCELILFDNLSGLAGDLDPNSDPGAKLQIMGPREFTGRGFTVLVVAHSGKPGPGAKPRTPIGHTSIDAFFRNRINLTPSKDIVTLTTDSNEMKALDEPLTIRLDNSTGIGRLVLTEKKVILKHAAAMSREAALMAAVEVIRDTGEQASVSAAASLVAYLFEGSTDKAKRAVAKLIDRGQCEQATAVPGAPPNAARRVWAKNPT